MSDDCTVEGGGDIVPHEPPEAEPTTLTPELAARIVKDAKPCMHCGGHHARACPRVKRLSWHPGGALAEVEFWPDGRWSDEHVLWPEQIPDSSDS